MQNADHPGMGSVASDLWGRGNTLAGKRRWGGESHARLPALDGFRGLAVLLVIFYHFSLPIIAAGTGDKLTKAMLHLVACGGIGVDMFFALSGFLITGILLDGKDRKYYFRNFYMRRVLRIFPLYYGVLIVCFGMLWWNVAIAPMTPHQGWLWLYVANFAGLRDVSLQPMFDHFWSLAVEEQFYLAWPLAVFCLSRRRLMGVSVALIAGSLALRCGLIVHGMNAELAASLTPCRLEGLLLGSLLAMLVREPIGLSGVQRPAMWIGLLAGLAAGGSKLAGGSSNSAWGMSGLGHFTIPLAFTCVLALAVWENSSGRGARRGVWGSALSADWLRFFGKYSYGLYVYHYLFQPWLDKWFWYARSLPLVSVVLHLVLALATTLIVALASWHLYEKQFLKLKNWFEPSPRMENPKPKNLTGPAKLAA